MFNWLRAIFVKPSNQVKINAPLLIELLKTEAFFDESENHSFDCYYNPSNNSIHVTYDGNVSEISIFDIEDEILLDIHEFIMNRVKNDKAIDNTSDS